MIGAAFEVHRQKGPGLIESIYDWYLIKELEISRRTSSPYPSGSQFALTLNKRKPRTQRIPSLNFSLSYLCDLLLKNMYK
ncbi:MAG: hypothetical protein O7C75_20365 [Verrucomicrobia bacterium]|nr:hypothetical protein [Verrucomicrobiota bacterium]